MPPSPTKPAASPLSRAYRALKSFDPRRKRLDDARAAAREGLSSRDGGIVAGLADATLRHAALIDLLIAHGSTVKPAKMERDVLAALRLGIASWLRGVEAHAAVNETVALLPGNHRARGLVNAVMRRAVESVTSRELTEPERANLRIGADGALPSCLTERSFPFNGERLIKARYPLFPAERDAALELLAGLPRWLGAKIRESLDDAEFAGVCLAAAQAPATWLRIVRGRETEAVEVLSAIPHRREGAAARLAPADAGAVFRSLSFAGGCFAVQDLSAQRPVARAVELGLVTSDMKCLDLCAAPGGKTCQLAEAALPDGLVLAFDVSEEKLARARDNVARLRLPNVTFAFGDGREAELAGKGKYDAALVDAPCSNSGVMARRVEVKGRLRERDIPDLVETQRRLLRNASAHLRPGGTLIYSTCSLLDEENGGLVRAFLEAEGGEGSGWRFLDEMLTLPLPGEHDGGYFALLRKS